MGAIAAEQLEEKDCRLVGLLQEAWLPELSATTPPSMDRLSWGPKVTVLPFQSPPSACHPHCRLPTSVP